MNGGVKNLDLFSTRVRQMILQYKQIMLENQQLRDALEGKTVEIKELKSQLSVAEKNYNNLKVAKMMEISDTDIDSARKRLSKLIRDVNKCITRLSEEKD